VIDIDVPPSRTELLERDRHTGQFTGKASPVWTKWFGDFIASIVRLANQVRQPDLTIAQLNALGLSGSDKGREFGVSVYNHRLRWTGTAFEFAPGDCGSHYFAERPGVPQETGWQLCDGTVTSYLVVGAVLSAAAFTTPNEVAGTFHKSIAAYTGSIDAAIAPTLTGTPAVLTGTVTAPVFTGTPAVLTGTVAAIGATATAALTSANAAGQNTADNLHTHPAPALTMNSYTPAGTNSVPVLTMNSYTPAGTISTAGRPPSLGVLRYYRR